MAFDPIEIARALRHVSGYTPAVDNAADIAARLEADPSALMTLAEELRFEAWVKTTKQAVADHSQFGEFKLLLQALVARAAPKGVVVDAGARERAGSNSYDLITAFGWRGVLIEAFPPRAERLRSEFGAGDYVVVPCAVGLHPGRQSLWLGPQALMASLDPAVLGEHEAVEVEVRRLAEIMQAEAVPEDFELLSIDIDGYDIPVLNDLVETSPFRPRYIIVEALHAFSRTYEELGFSQAFLAAYREIGRTLPNILFERCGAAARPVTET